MRAVSLVLIGVCCTYSERVFAQDSPIADQREPAVIVEAPAVKDSPQEAKAKPSVWATRKSEAILETSMAGGSSTWAGDPVALSEMRLGFRFMETGALYVQSALGYAPVNSRELVQVAIGAQVWLRVWHARPYLRIGAIHQHEESTAAWKTDFAESLFGVGNGIRHRAGGEGALGLDVPFYRGEKVEVVGTIEASSPWFPDEKGPHFYFLGGLGLGIHYAL